MCTVCIFHGRLHTKFNIPRQEIIDNKHDEYDCYVYGYLPQLSGTQITSKWSHNMFRTQLFLWPL